MFGGSKYSVGILSWKVRSKSSRLASYSGVPVGMGLTSITAGNCFTIFAYEVFDEDKLLGRDEELSCRASGEGESIAAVSMMVTYSIYHNGRIPQDVYQHGIDPCLRWQLYVVRNYH